MSALLTPLNIARALLVIGFAIGWESLYQTFNHIGDQRYLIKPEHPGGIHHAWYHALREVFADVSTILFTLIVFFGKSWFRTPGTWWVLLIALLGYYLPFWAGMPFIPELSAPSWSAEIRHILQAVIPLSALFVARKSFFLERND